MANVYKNIQAVVNASGSDVSMYTSPDATTSIIKTIKLFNTHGSALDVTSKVFDASSSTDFEYEVSNVLASNGVDLLTFNNILILEAGDILKMQTTQTLNVVLKARDFPGQSLTTDQTTAFTASTTKIDTRARARQAVVRFESDDDADTGARLGVGFVIGATRLDLQPNGRR